MQIELRVICLYNISGKTYHLRIAKFIYLSYRSMNNFSKEKSFKNFKVLVLLNYIYK